ncbi:Uncharacterised protein [Vibrio cholerae]|nr:Uncharacterised protein [Vibrio cholerae]CSH90401.1 Uncharacterised protein [Vibrio cholerae]
MEHIAFDHVLLEVTHDIAKCCIANIGGHFHIR